MKTIEELVAQVAKNVGAADKPPKPIKKPAAVPEVKKTEDKPISAPAGKTRKAFDKGMTLEKARVLSKAAQTAACALGVKVVTAVCDEGANLVLLEAMDDSYIASIRAAQDKAYTAVALKMPTHLALEESRGGGLDGLTNGNGILLLGGGFPLESGNKIYGGIGVSGGTKEQDMLIASVAKEVLRVLTEK